MPVFEFMILGPLEVRRDGARVDLGGPQRRALLACLLTRPNTHWTRHELIDSLWGDASPDQAPDLLRSLISRLRRVLEPDRPAHSPSEMLPSAPGGYTFVVDPQTIDAVKFVDAIETGRRQLADGQAQDAASTLAAALELWRGAVLAEHDHLDFARVEAARLGELRLTAVELLHEARLEIGDHARVASDLEPYTAEHPFRERLWELYLLGLYRSGRQADALRSYEGFRRRLVEELGVDPCPALQNLEHKILAQDPSIDRSEPPRKTATGLPTDKRLPFVGRALALERIDEALRRAGSSGRQIVLVSGEPAVGKTRLVDEAGRSGATSGARYMAGRCTEDGEATYQPFVEALRSLIMTEPPGSLARLLGRFPGELIRLAPELGDLVPDLPPATRSDPETERYRLFDAVVSWLTAVADQGPAILALDDIQWASPPTLNLALHVARAPSLGRLLLIGTYRNTDVAESSELQDFIAELHRLGGTTNIQLEGLDLLDVVDLLKAVPSVPGGADVTALAETIHRDTGGNPFFVGEVVRHLQETGEIQTPESIRATLEARVTRLGDEGRKLLNVAAVAGEQFGLPVVAHAAGVTEDSAVDTLEECVRLGLVREDSNQLDSFEFVHGLVRSTVLDSLSTSRRARLHHRVGAALADRAPDASPIEIARHFLAAGPAGDPDRAADHALEAAEIALASAANEDCVDVCRRALDICPSPSPHRHRLLTVMGSALRALGAPEAGPTLAEAMTAAADNDDDEWLARAALASRREFWSGVGEVDQQVVGALRGALASSDATDLRMRARLLSSLAAELGFQGDGVEQRALTDEAINITRRLDEVNLLAEVLMLRRLSVWEPSLSERLEVTEELERLIDSVTDPVLKWRSHGACIVTRLEAGQIGRARHHVDNLEALGRDLGDPRPQWSAAFHQALLAQLAGDLEAFERHADRAAAIGHPAGGADRLLARAGQSFWLLIERGQYDDAMEFYELAAEFAEDQQVALMGAGALLSAGLGRDDDARHVLGTFRRRWEEDPRHDPVRVVAMCMAVEAAARLRDTEFCRFAVNHLAAHSGSLAVVSGFTLGAVDRFLGLCAWIDGDLAHAERLFDAAAEMHRAIGARGFLARTRADLAAMLADRKAAGDGARARDLLHAVIDTAHDIGLQELEGRSTNLLEQTGG